MLVDTTALLAAVPERPAPKKIARSVQTGQAGVDSTEMGLLAQREKRAAMLALPFGFERFKHRIAAIRPSVRLLGPHAAPIGTARIGQQRGQIAKRQL